MKEIINKSRERSDNFPKQLIIHQIEIRDAKSTAENFCKYFVYIGPQLASKIPSTNIRL